MDNWLLYFIGGVCVWNSVLLYRITQEFHVNLLPRFRKKTKSSLETIDGSIGEPIPDTELTKL